MLVAASLVLALLAGYAGTRLLETAPARRFSNNHPVLGALGLGVLAVLLAAAFFALYWRQVGEVRVSQFRLFIFTSAYLLGVVVPTAVIVRRMGFSPWWAVIALIPMCQFLGLWMLALKRWPREKSGTHQAAATAATP